MLSYWTARTDLEKEQFKSKVRLAAARRHKVRDPSQPPQTLDMDTYQMCLRAASLLECHPNWNYITSRGRHGYLAVKCPDHPHCTPKGTVAIHRLVLECKLGRFLRFREVAHHINGQIRDNRACNLESLTLSQHSKMHARPCPMRHLTCSFCGHPFERPTRHKLPASGNVFDSYSCSAQFYRLGREINRPAQRLPPEEKRHRKTAYMRYWRKQHRKVPDLLDKPPTTC